MDPLSVIASCIAVATIAQQTCQAFTELRTLCKEIPGRLHALNNEVADIELVLLRVAKVAENRETFQTLCEVADDADDHGDIPKLLGTAQDRLTELHKFAVDLAAACSGSTHRIAIFRAQAWKKAQTKLAILQDGVKSVKCSLNILLGASNSRDMIRMRIDLQSLSTVTSSIPQQQSLFRNDVLTSLARHHDSLAQVMEERLEQKLGQLFQERLDNVTDLIRLQSTQFQGNQNSQLPPTYLESVPLRLRRPSAHKKTKTKSHNSPPSKAATPSTTGVFVRVAQYLSVCRPACPCACHTEAKSTTPTFINRVVGRLFVGYAGVPLLSPKCNSKECEKAQSPHITVEYWFPLGFCWSKILQFQLGYNPNFGPQFSLKTLRQVPDSAQCVQYAIAGNIDGLKNLFSRGLASPWDVSRTRGYTMVRWALYAKQYKTVKFLVQAGSDPDYKPVAETDNNARNKACDNALQGTLNKEAQEYLRCLTAGDDWVEEQEFTKIHKIVCGLLFGNLEEELSEHPEYTNARDAMDRTPLLWAAARGDAQAIVTLLAYGADVDILDIYKSPPISYAADSGHTLCVRLLLEAGANPDPKFPPDVIAPGSALNCAARNARDPLILKYLLDFGADVDATYIDGMTSLIHASRIDNINFALLLLEYNANINAMSITQQTPLTTAITYNSHRVLQLLLDRWDEYSECPRLKGPHLLDVTALYADFETVRILTKTDHFKLVYEKNFTIGNFAKLLTERSDVTDELIQAFQSLLAVIEEPPPSTGAGVDDLMEAGLLSHRSSDLASAYEGQKVAAENGNWGGDCTDSDDEDTFEDTIEGLEIENLDSEKEKKN